MAYCLIKSYLPRKRIARNKQLEAIRFLIRHSEISRLRRRHNVKCIEGALIIWGKKSAPTNRRRIIKLSIAKQFGPSSGQLVSAAIQFSVKYIAVHRGELLPNRREYMRAVGENAPVIFGATITAVHSYFKVRRAIKHKASGKQPGFNGHKTARNCIPITRRRAAALSRSFFSKRRHIRDISPWLMVAGFFLPPFDPRRPFDYFAMEAQRASIIRSWSY